MRLMALGAPWLRLDSSQQPSDYKSRCTWWCWPPGRLGLRQGIPTVQAVSMHPMALGAPFGAQFPVTHTRDGITQHNTAHNGLIPPLCANDVA